MGVQHHTPAALPPGNNGTHCTGGWVGPRAGLDVCEKSRLTGIQFPDHPASIQSLYRLSYPAQKVTVQDSISIASSGFYKLATIVSWADLKGREIAKTVMFCCLCRLGSFTMVIYMNVVYLKHIPKEGVKRKYYNGKKRTKLYKFYCELRIV
jgi:hypothetical protein